MNHTLQVAVFASLASLTLLADAPKNDAAAKRSERDELRGMGGFIAKPNSAKGFVAVVNRQTRVPESEFRAALGSVDYSVRFNFRFVSDEEQAKGAGLVIRIFDDPARPALLVAPEDRWAEINVARLADDLKLESSRAKFTVSRARKMFLRAYAYAAGAGGSGFEGNLLDTSSIRDLDYRKEFIPMDAVSAIERHLTKQGLVREHVTTYMDACEEGWAPQPTNDVQKAVWDKVHALPTEPIRILPEKVKK